MTTDGPETRAHETAEVFDAGGAPRAPAAQSGRGPELVPETGASISPPVPSSVVLPARRPLLRLLRFAALIGVVTAIGVLAVFVMLSLSTAENVDSALGSFFPMILPVALLGVAVGLLAGLGSLGMVVLVEQAGPRSMLIRSLSAGVGAASALAIVVLLLTGSSFEEGSSFGGGWSLPGLVVLVGGIIAAVALPLREAVHGSLAPLAEAPSGARLVAARLALTGLVLVVVSVGSIFIEQVSPAPISLRFEPQITPSPSVAFILFLVAGAVLLVGAVFLLIPSPRTIAPARRHPTDSRTPVSNGVRGRFDGVLARLSIIAVVGGAVLLLFAWLDSNGRELRMLHGFSATAQRERATLLFAFAFASVLAAVVLAIVASVLVSREGATMGRPLAPVVATGMSLAVLTFFVWAVIVASEEDTVPDRSLEESRSDRVPEASSVTSEPAPLPPLLVPTDLYGSAETKASVENMFAIARAAAGSRAVWSYPDGASGPIVEEYVCLDTGVA